MDDYEILRQLLDLARSMGLVIRAAPSSAPEEHPGGAIVRLRGQEILFLDPHAAVGDRIAVTAAALVGRRELEELYLSPEIRQILEAPPRS